MLTEKQVSQQLAQAEASLGLFSYSLGGVSLWRLLRAPVGHSLQGLGLKTQSQAMPLALLLRGMRSLSSIIRALLGRRCRYVVKTYSSALREEKGDGYADVYFDALLERVPGGHKWSFCNSAAFAVRESRASIRVNLDTTFIQIASSVLAIVCPFHRSASEYLQLADLANRAFGAGTLDASRVRKTYAKFRWQVCFYSLLLQRLRPKAVLVADTGEYALMRAAQKSGIRFIELQHGIFSPDHPDALPAEALSQTQGDLLLPDLLAVYGDYWRDCLACSALASLDRIVACGCSAIDQYRGLRASALRNRSPSDPMRLLLTAQGFSVAELVCFIREFMCLVGRPVELSIKLHPIYDEEASYRVLAPDSRVRILESGHATPTHQLIAESDMHLSISSACHYDALALGVPTVVLGLLGHELMKPLLEQGAALLVDSPAALVSLIQAWEHCAGEDASERFCRQGFVENLSGVAGIGSPALIIEGS